MNMFARLVCTGLLASTACTLLPTSQAHAHGIWGHIHVTGWAIENLPPGELRDFFDDPAVFNAAVFGAAFCDSGYWPQSGDIQEPARNYGEHSHWEPFVEDFVQWIAVNDPPPWESLESRQRVAFLMGVASHGMQDEIFDSIFLNHIAEQEGGTQDNADPATDGFLVSDGHIRFIPTPWIPMETVLELYEVLEDERITEEVVQGAVDIMVTLYVNDALGLGIAEGQGDANRDDLQWTAAHYMDTAIPGSLRSEIIPTMRYIESLWLRLHGEWTPEDLVIHSFPEQPRRLMGHLAASPASWVTLVAGRGVRAGTATVNWLDDASATVDFALNGTRWGGNTAWGRLIQLRPNADLRPGGNYTLELAPGTEVIGTEPSSAAWSLAFQVECDPTSAGACPDLGVIAEPRIDGSEPPAPEIDADAGTSSDTGAEADASSPDTTSTSDATPNDSVTTQPGEGCTAARTTSPSPLWLAVALALATRYTRSRSSRFPNV
jgi:hypothetical protein